MLKFILSVCLLLTSYTHFVHKSSGSVLPSRQEEPAVDSCEILYTHMQLAGKVDYTAFRQAVAGFYQIEKRRRNLLTLIDFSKPSTEKRLFVFDLDRQKLVLSSWVAHGRNSGGNYATDFSNQNGSYKSSLGFYLTESTYHGKNGYSLQLNGLEKGINDNARQRAIVMHGAAYANPSTIRSNGRLGRSLGCPAVPQAISHTLIDTIKEGSVLYIYAATPDYLTQSSILHAPNSSRQGS